MYNQAMAICSARIIKMARDTVNHKILVYVVTKVGRKISLNRIILFNTNVQMISD
jgi:hypothetical protein